MKRITFLLPLLLILLLAVDSLAAQPLIPELPVIAGLADEGGHGDDEDAHADDEDDHNDDDGHANDDGHHDDDGGHANDDGHHGGPFTWASLTPLFAGLGVAAVVSGASAALIRPSLRSSDLVVVALSVVTGVLHLVIGLSGYQLLLLNGLGFLALVAALYQPFFQTSLLKTTLRIVLLLYTLVTIAGYFFLHSLTQIDALGVASKLVELALVLVLAVQLGQGQESDG